MNLDLEYVFLHRKISSFHFVGRSVGSISTEGKRGAIVLTEFILSRGELLSSISLSSSSKSVSNISVASDIGLAASCRMLKNASLGCAFWNISTRWSMGVVGEYPGWLRVSKEHSCAYGYHQLTILPDVQWGISVSEGTARTLAFAVAGRLSVYD